MPTVRRGPLFVSACAGIALFGIALVFPGLLFGLESFRIRMGVTDPVRQGAVQATLMFAVFLSAVFVGPLIDRYGNKIVLTVGSAVLAAGLTWFAFATGYVAARQSAFVIGLGAGVLNIATNVLVSEIYVEDRGEKLNLLGMFFSVGALLLPLLSASIAWFTLDRLMLLGAVLAAATAIAYASLPFPQSGGHGASLREILGVARYPAVLLFAFVLFCESGNEMAFIGWTTGFALDAGSSVRGATLMLALFQAMMMSGRIVASQVIDRVGKARMILACSLGVLAGSILLLASRSLVLCWVAIGVIGLSCAPIYQTILAMAGDRYQRLAGTVFGLLFSVSLIGSFVSPLVVGRLAATAGMRSGAIVPIAGAAAIVVLISIIRAQQPSCPS